MKVSHPLLDNVVASSTIYLRFFKTLNNQRPEKKEFKIQCRLRKERVEIIYMVSSPLDVDRLFLAPPRRHFTHRKTYSVLHFSILFSHPLWQKRNFLLELLCLLLFFFHVERVFEREEN